MVNYLPPRPSLHVGGEDDKSASKFQLKLRTWLHIVARIRTFPKEPVCGEECEQHAVYGRLFDAHPLEKSNSKNASDDDDDDEDNIE